MALKRPLAFLKVSSDLTPSICIQCRHARRLSTRAAPVPKPTPFVPDVQTFLTLIGRGLSQHAAKIPSWEALFSSSSQQLRESGVEPARARRYLLWWRERFRNGLVGIGGDMTSVKDGIGHLRIVEVPSSRKADRFATVTKSAGTRKMIVNTTPGELQLSDGGEPSVAVSYPKMDASEAVPVAGTEIMSGSTIRGRGIRQLKGRQGAAELKVQEGLWEQKRGQKKDGGERRRAEVRAKRRIQERKNAA